MSSPRIPTEIDETIWAVAESNDPRAVEDFGLRYPAYRAALVDRIQLVRKLRSSRPEHEVPVMKFRPAPRRAENRWPILAVGGLLFASFAWGTAALLGQRHSPTPLAEASSLNVAVPPANGQGDGRTSPLSLAPGDTPKAPKDETRHESESAKPEPAPDPFARPVDVDKSHVRLSAVIAEIGRQAKLRLEIAPGLEDVDVNAKYAGISAMDALRDLGDNFGFTVMVQEGEHALIIPAIDRGRGPEPGLPASGSGIDPSGKLVPGGPNGG